MVRDPDLVKDIFCVKDSRVQKQLLNPFVNLLTMGVVALKGQKWIKRRKLIMPTFHIDKLKGMSPVFLISCGQLIKRWDKQLAAALKGLTGDIISKTAFGSCYEEGRRVFQLQEELSFLVLEACKAIYVPGIRCHEYDPIRKLSLLFSPLIPKLYIHGSPVRHSWYIPTRRNRRITYLNNEIKSMLREQIRRKEAAIEKGASVKEDLLGFLLHSVRDGQGDIIVGDVIEECKPFNFVGHEPTTVTLTWAMVVLSMHHDWQQKAREEVLQVLTATHPTSTT
ncbi:hypothetical protein Taro_037475 [Colocasia esculenta]|uniref:Cytochrome P450 n=1 Tax=Colocasia esculenta TaxID=4460 RepID=A0A843W0M7_COLES|nr:hypothetical protein [Colocasia esculenta]